MSIIFNFLNCSNSTLGYFLLQKIRPQTSFTDRFLRGALEWFVTETPQTNVQTPELWSSLHGHNDHNKGNINITIVVVDALLRCLKDIVR